MARLKKPPTTGRRDSMQDNKVKLSEAARQARNAASREWRMKHKDRVREYNRRYWEKKAQEALQDG